MNEKTMLLAIGNSFSCDALHFLPRIAADLGREIGIANLFVGGCALDQHVRFARNEEAAYTLFTSGIPAPEAAVPGGGDWMKTPGFSSADALRMAEWDFVSMQQSSGVSGLSETYELLPELIAYVRRYQSAARLLWHMTWAFQRDSEHGQFVFYGWDQDRMYRHIAETVRNTVLPSGAFAGVVPCGTAVQNSRTSSLGDHLTLDGYHLSRNYGRYLAALCFAKYLFGSIDRVTYRPAEVSEEAQRIAVASVNAAFAAPFSVTGIDG